MPWPYGRPLQKFATYDAWLMAGGAQPPSIDEARPRAETLVGAKAFQRMLAAPELDPARHHTGKIYQTLEAGEIPKLLLPREVA